MWRHFDQYASRYDAWFDRFPGKQIFPLEQVCLKYALEDAQKPWCEIGVGTGRFAQALGIEKGVDPSTEVLRIARTRGIDVIMGRAEELPLGDKSIGTAILVVTLCFLDDPEIAFSELDRVIKLEGSIVIGMVPRESPWGKYYQEKKSQGRPFYSDARFYSVDEAVALLERHGFVANKIFSTLTDLPERETYPYHEPIEGVVEGAGFVVIRAMRGNR